MFDVEYNEIESVECIGEFENEYVYDIEMEDDTEHTFFANDILVHNSAFFTISPILKKLNKSFLTASGKISREAYALEQELNDVINDGIKKWATDNLNSIDPRLVFKREAMCDTAIFIQKKRYILHILDLKGFEVDKMKYVGVEVQRSDIPKETKHYIKDVVETIMKTKNYSKTTSVYFEAFEHFKTLKIEEIAYPRGLHNLDKYMAMSNGLSIGKGTPVHAKAAIYYNFLLDKLNLSSKYQKIKGDTKIKWFYTKKNKYGIEVIGYLDKYPKEFELEVDFDKMFSKIVGAAVDRLYNTIGWRVKNPNCQEAVDLFDMLS